MAHSQNKENNYEKLEFIGCGAFSKVYKAKRKNTGEIVAMKIVDIEHHGVNISKRILNEINILSLIAGHDNIVKLKDAETSARHYYIITDYCETSLKKMLRCNKNIGESQLRRYLKHLACGLEFLHSKNIFHKDIKPDNLLIKRTSSSEILKIADFGLSEIATDEFVRRGLASGTSVYMAPEILLNEPSTKIADLWSAGATMYECLYGHLIQHKLSVQEIKILLGKKPPIKIPSQPFVTLQCINLLKGLLTYEPKSRLNASQFFNHEYFNSKNDPVDELKHRILSYAQQAVDLDMKNQYDQAFEMYCVSIHHLIPLLKELPSGPDLASYEGKLLDYLSRAKTIELKHLKNKKMQLSGTQLDDILGVLFKNTPKIRDALSIGREGEYFLSENKQIAQEKLLGALNILVPLLDQEPAGPRKNLLGTLVSQWMDLVKKLQDNGSSTGIQEAQAVTSDEEAHCILQ